MAGENEQVPVVCSKCSATLIGGRDLSGCWRCGWEDYSQLGTGLTQLLGSSMSESWQPWAAVDSRAGLARTGERRE